VTSSKQAALAGIGAAIVVAAGIAWFLSQRPAQQATERTDSAGTATFVGSERCAECHAEEMRAWQGSQHQLAMQLPGDGSVLGDFDDASFTYAGVTSSFERREGRYVVRTDDLYRHIVLEPGRNGTPPRYCSCVGDRMLAMGGNWFYPVAIGEKAMTYRSTHGTLIGHGVAVRSLHPVEATAGLVL